MQSVLLIHAYIREVLEGGMDLKGGEGPFRLSSGFNYRSKRLDFFFLLVAHLALACCRRVGFAMRGLALGLNAIATNAPTLKTSLFAARADELTINQNRKSSTSI